MSDVIVFWLVCATGYGFAWVVSDLLFWTTTMTIIKTLDRAKAP